MMTFGIMLLVIWAGYAVLTKAPVRGVRPLGSSELASLTSNRDEYKLVDIRDYMDYERGHVQHAVNLPLGRLTFTWDRVVSGEDRIILLGEHVSHLHAAARKLKRLGLKPEAYHVLGVQSAQTDKPVCCCGCV